MFVVAIKVGMLLGRVLNLVFVDKLPPLLVPLGGHQDHIIRSLLSVKDEG